MAWDFVANIKGADGVGGGGSAGGALTPVQHHTLGDETFTIVGGSVIAISGTTIQGQAVSVNDRILVINAPSGTNYVGTGTAYGFNNCPANGIYVVNSIGTDMSVSRASDFSGSVKPAGLLVFSENALAGWMAQSIFAVRSPYAPVSITYGADWIQFRPVGGANLAVDSMYCNYGRIGFWNETPVAETYLYTNAGATQYVDQNLYLPATDEGRIIARKVVLVNSVLTFGSLAGTEYIYLLKTGAVPTLPTAVNNKAFYRVKNTTNNQITLFSAGGKIDNSSSILLRAGTSVDIVSDNTDYFVL
jgi:hypothetical protein